jgi:SAM-dependent methyltransferase
MGFTAVADSYERGRPPYPPEAVAHLADVLSLGPTSAVLDLAAGTGKLTRRLLPLVGDVVAVDPSKPMLEKLRDCVPGVRTRVGAAENIPCAADSFDAVFVGEAFHWFDVPAAAREAARVLHSRGALALLWNRSRWNEDDLQWMRDFRQLTGAYREAAGPYPGDDWRAMIELTGLFEPAHRFEVAHSHSLSAADFVALVASWSWVANAAAEQRRTLLAQVGELVRDHSPIRLPYVTEVHYARLR